MDITEPGSPTERSSDNPEEEVVIPDNQSDISYHKNII
eukprot:CAMPEP_0176356400 /NCGR_PEP_ID=MMETSP0126-20121128/13990_1 /TAXON_ID=141414 ORGANISM="Strombidinopsis acuminatum, Strain SPMC142" /NCGR_SAMPLE_ID=MMETSP0126 /ASSEMBLY_ACC=CAM_ASM_000229 /LENGTH=37 /DNA_ID= /DNA_START= /DNA_END= /DNA_ORIENTATION=